MVLFFFARLSIMGAFCVYVARLRPVVTTVSCALIGPFAASCPLLRASCFMLSPISARVPERVGQCGRVPLIQCLLIRRLGFPLIDRFVSIGMQMLHVHGGVLPVFVSRQRHVRGACSYVCMHCFLLC